MSGPLGELYNRVILDHYRNPRHYHVLEGADCEARGVNPMCGDRVTLYLRYEGDRIAEAAFQGAGCAISQASASLMTAALQGRTRKEAETLLRAFLGMVTGSASPACDLGELRLFESVAGFPARVQCARLAWDTLEGALKGAE